MDDFIGKPFTTDGKLYRLPDQQFANEEPQGVTVDYDQLIAS